MLKMHNPINAILEIQPVAGLCNRLRAIASAICAAREAGRPLKIYWTQQYSICRGTPADLFDLSATPLQFEDAGFGGLPPYPHRECLTIDDWNRMSFRGGHMPIYIKSYGVFWQKNKAVWLEALRSIKPAADIQALIDKASVQTMVGVHIRRTDHTKAIAASPTSAFIAAMETYPPTQHFFVATDDERERAALILKFPGRIHWFTHSLDRDSPAGAKAAMADFLALSRCAEILGSAHSSFSEIAAAYGGCPLRVITPSV